MVKFPFALDVTGVVSMERADDAMPVLPAAYRAICAPATGCWPPWTLPLTARSGEVVDSEDGPPGDMPQPASVIATASVRAAWSRIWGVDMGATCEFSLMELVL